MWASGLRKQRPSVGKIIDLSCDWLTLALTFCLLSSTGVSSVVVFYEMKVLCIVDIMNDRLCCARRITLFFL